MAAATEEGNTFWLTGLDPTFKARSASYPHTMYSCSRLLMMSVGPLPRLQAYSRPSIGMGQARLDVSPV